MADGSELPLADHVLHLVNPGYSLSAAPGEENSKSAKSEDQPGLWKGDEDRSHCLCASPSSLGNRQPHQHLVTGRVLKADAGGVRKTSAEINLAVLGGKHCQVFMA